MILGKGSVLIISLWVLFLLTFFTVTLSNVIMQKLNISNRVDTGIKSYFAAKAGIETAKAILKEDETKDYDGTFDNWTNDEGLFKDKKIGEGCFNIAYQINTDKPEPRTVYGMIDEERKLNINKVPQEVLTRFFNLREIDKAQELAVSIIDWRDEDSQATQGGAENTYYNNLQYPYGARNSYFESIYELLLVKDMTEEYFNAIKEYITVFGGGCVNVNTAQEQVLNAVGLNPGLVAKIIEYRNGPDAEPFTFDDRAFENTANIKSELDSFRKLSDEETNQIDIAISNNLIGVKSEYFKVKAEGKVTGKGFVSNIDCVISRNGDILFWHEE